MKGNWTKNSGGFVGLTAGALAAAVTLSATGSTFHVDGATGNDNNNGFLWSTSFKTVRKALVAVDPNSDDVIWVAAGTYYPDEIDGGDSDDRADTFSLVDGVKLYGGFLNGDDFEDRDPAVNITILSGDIDQDGVRDDNSYHVVRAENVATDTLLNGFTIVDGFANGGEGTNFGGAIRIKHASPKIVKCFLSNNRAANSSGAVDIRGSRGTPANPEFVNCVFVDNTVIYANGGAVSVGVFAAVTFVNCNFNNNETLGMAGNSLGGAVWVISDATFQQCTFAANQVPSDGEGGAVAVGATGSATFTSCILWGNLAGIEADQIDGIATVTYSDVQGGWTGTGNINTDPLFSDASSGNYRLYYLSPCIDAADTDALPLDGGDIDEDGITNEELPRDLDLNDRRTDDPDTSDTGNGTAPIVDMGGYEFAPCPADIDGDCVVGVADLLILLADWGACPDCDDCPADINDDCTVGAVDLLSLLASWGICSCSDGTGPLSLQEELADACLTPEDWDDFLDKMQNGTEAEKENYLCWMEHYLFDCNKCTCTHIPMCPGPDPFSG